MLHFFQWCLFHWRWYLFIGFAIYIVGLAYDAETQFEDIDPYPVMGLLLIPFWPFIGAWIGICYTLSKLGVGPFKD